MSNFPTALSTFAWSEDAWAFLFHNKVIFWWMSAYIQNNR